MTGLATVVLGFVGRWKLAVIFASVTAVFALVPFALWEDEFCPLIDPLLQNLNIIRGDEGCARSWSYGFQQVVAHTRPLYLLRPGTPRAHAPLPNLPQGVCTPLFR